MPSIPQSLLWISLVVLWLFVLVPMLINKRETVRRTSDVALATRVLDGEARSRLVRRGGPATGHRHDPDWQRDDDFSDELDEVEEYDEAVRAARSGARSQSAMVMAMANRSGMVEEAQTQPVYLDVDGAWRDHLLVAVTAEEIEGSATAQLVRRGLAQRI